MFIEVLFFIFSLILTLLFFLYGFNHYYLLNAARKYKTPPLPDHSLGRPTVSIQLPVYNERYVIGRLVSACAGMAAAYGIDKVRILVLDDSNDDTVLEVDKVVEEFKEKHFNIEVQRRQDRIGFKAGALQAALNRTEEEYIAIFDADFIPSADFLLRTIPFFERDEQLGIVQSRWTHLNRDFNFLTRAIALGIDVHFLIEQPGRYAAGCFQNFNGSGGVLRKQAIMDAGGWRADTLAEDLDLSYRMQVLGFRILYLRDLECPGEIPPTVPSFKMQQGRWACGSLRNARNILPGLLQNRKIGVKERLQAVIHITGYMIHPLMVISFVLTCLAVLLGVNNPQPTQVTALLSGYGNAIIPVTMQIQNLQNLIWAILLPFLILCTLGPWISLISTLKSQNLPLLRNLGSLLVLILLSLGISLSNMREAGKALLSNRIWEFKRTPKYADLQNKQDWRTRRYQISIDPLWVTEFFFTLAGLLAIWSAIRHTNFSVLMILVPFTFSYGFVLWLSIQQSRKEKAW
jgi:cellulose synthase/poly-beta-1,6-N-acetylglucosamine synthase-like glycosyltransferase